jgi:trehalose/maltose hydrolase-like predicted phosphorylase
MGAPTRELATSAPIPVERSNAFRVRPQRLARRFEAIVFDWDGTAVPDRSADASVIRELVEALSKAGMDLVVVSGTHVGNVDRQLHARPRGPGRLYLCLNRGSEAFVVDRFGPMLGERREALPEEDRALDHATALVVDRLSRRRLTVEVISQRLNRRKIDLIPGDDWRDPPKARIDELIAAVDARLREAGIDGLPEVVRIARAAALEAGIPDPRVTSDAKHVEIGLTDKSDSARWAFERLRRSGIAPSQVLVAGDEFGPLGGVPGSDSFMLIDEAASASAFSVGREPSGVPATVVALGGGPERFVEVLRDQLDRRARGESPEIDADPAWTLTIDRIDPKLERVNEALLTLADGRIGTSGSPMGIHPSATPRVVVAGMYEADEKTGGLLACPIWGLLPRWIGPDDSCRRTLDLRTALLRDQLETADGEIHAVRFSSLAEPGLGVMRVHGPSEAIVPAPAPALPAGVSGEQGRVGRVAWARLHAGEGGVVVAVADADSPAEADVLDRFAVYSSAPERRPRRTGPIHAADRAAEAGFDAAFGRHRETWAARWEDADVRIVGDADLQIAVRLALFHLIGSVADAGEAAVGARGLTGSAYRGHVFWDSDVFVLPFLAATHPSAARAMLEYRIRRLPAARSIARAAGREGVKFPWESARTGFDVTPTSARDRMGRVVPIRTGRLEDHIVADIAWAAACYEGWTGDEPFADGPGADLLFETARFWTSRIRWDRVGDGHVYGVIGPDEYHEPVDDNAFTNVMARWNLRRAAARAEGDGRVAEFERMRWLEVADALVDGFDPHTRVYEQFAGFHALEPLIVADVASRRPIAADLLLGRDRVRSAQVIKQADVLMLHHLVPDEVAQDSLVPNLDFYEPRTAHGSSLSPGIHASLFARAGRIGDALAALDVAARMDLDDLTGTTAGGLHLATMGSLWQALAFGFLGLRPNREVLRIDPRVVPGWGALEMALRFRGSRVRIEVREGELHVRADRPTTVAVRAADPVIVGPGHAASWSNIDTEVEGS